MQNVDSIRVAGKWACLPAPARGFIPLNTVTSGGQRDFPLTLSAFLWKSAPAYDLTYSASIGGEHATTVAGNGRNPGFEDILAVAESASISRSWAKRTAREVEEKTQSLVRYQG